MSCTNCTLLLWIREWMRLIEGNSVKSTSALLPKCFPYVLEDGSPFLGEDSNQPFATISKKKCFSNALRHTLVVLEMH